MPMLAARPAIRRPLNSPPPRSTQANLCAASSCSWRCALRLAARWMLRMSPAIVCAVASSSSLRAEPGDARQPSPDKSGYTLFNATPGSLLREFTTDRPDVTESPITVDAGHFQVELSFVEYGRDRDHGTNNDEFDVLPFNFKVGLLNNVDLQFVLTPYVNDRTQTSATPPGSAATEHRGGASNFAMRFKINFWGNDGLSPTFGDTAFGFMPFISFPTGTNGLGSDHVEGGLIFPLAIALPGKFDLGLMAEVDFARNEADTAYGIEFVHTATLDHKLFGPLGGYIEYVGVAPRETGGGYQASFSSGLTCALGANAQWDAGVLVGLDRRAQDLRLFSGFSIRY